MLTRMLPCDRGGIACAAALIRAGALVAFPTETVYGLGGNARDPSAVARIYAAKGRPADNPLIVHVADVSEIGEWGVADTRTRLLAKAFWPGPLTLVTPGRGLFGTSTIALRMPGQPVALALLRETGRPVAAPSANRSGRPSPTTAAAALAEMDGRIEAVLLGPRAAVGIESTVLDVTRRPAAILRPGGISAAQISDILGERVAEEPDSDRSPGTRYRHYAPDVTLHLFADEDSARLRRTLAEALLEHPGSVYIGLAEVAPVGARGLLAPDLEILQHGLYDALLNAEREHREVVAALPGLSRDSAGVRDRMLRAAGFRVHVEHGEGGA